MSASLFHANHSVCADNCPSRQHLCYPAGCGIDFFLHPHIPHNAVNQSLCNTGIEICSCNRFFAWEDHDHTHGSYDIHGCHNTWISYLFSACGFLLLVATTYLIFVYYMHMLMDIKNVIEYKKEEKEEEKEEMEVSLTRLPRLPQTQTQTETKSRTIGSDEPTYHAFYFCVLTGCLLCITQTLFAWRSFLTPLFVGVDFIVTSRYHIFVEQYALLFWSSLQVVNLVTLSMSWLEQAKHLDPRPLTKEEEKKQRWFKLFMIFSVWSSFFLLVLEIVLANSILQITHIRHHEITSYTIRQFHTFFQLLCG